jgi:seryl-tRNA synthetase
LVPADKVKEFRTNTEAVARQLSERFNALNSQKSELEKTHAAVVAEMAQVRDRFNETQAAIQSYSLVLEDIPKPSEPLKVDAPAEDAPRRRARR